MNPCDWLVTFFRSKWAREMCPEWVKYILSIYVTILPFFLLLHKIRSHLSVEHTDQEFYWCSLAMFIGGRRIVFVSRFVRKSGSNLRPARVCRDPPVARLPGTSSRACALWANKWSLLWPMSASARYSQNRNSFEASTDRCQPAFLVPIKMFETFNVWLTLTMPNASLRQDRVITDLVKFRRFFCWIFSVVDLPAIRADL